MSPRRDLTLTALLIVQVVLMWATLDTSVGARLWHHFASLGVVMVLSAMFWRPLVHSRRFLALGVLITSLLAVVSGFWLLYWKEGIRVDGIQDWGVFWHIAWSWAAMVFFVMHTWINRVAFVHFFRLSVQTVRAAGWHAGAYLAAVVGLVVSGTVGRSWFSNENYIQHSLWAWLVMIVVPYMVWAYARIRRSERSEVHAARARRRRVDLFLVPVSALAVVSGLPLIVMGDWLDANGLKYASKLWHVWPSVMFAVFAFIHSVQAWSSVRMHWRKAGVDTRSITGRTARL